jgi:hypothetical protein
MHFDDMATPSRGHATQVPSFGVDRSRQRASDFVSMAVVLFPGKLVELRLPTALTEESNWRQAVAAIP